MRDDEPVAPLNPFDSLMEVSASASATAESVLALQSDVRQQLALAEGTVQLIHTRQPDALTATASLDAARDALNINVPMGRAANAAVAASNGFGRRAIGLIGLSAVMLAAGTAAAMMWINTSGPAAAVFAPQAAPQAAVETMIATAITVPDASVPPAPPTTVLPLVLPSALPRAEAVDDLGQSVYATTFAAAPAHERKCLARAIYYEARGETYEGQVAVAQVVVNRVRMKGWPDSICGVVQQGIERGEKCQFSFACHAPAVEPTGELWDNAKSLANDVIAGRAWLREVTEATHYHTVNVAPVWRLGLQPIRTIGSHIFYRETDELAKVAKPYNPLATPSVMAVQVKRPRPIARSAGGDAEGKTAAAASAPVTITTSDR